MRLGALATAVVLLATGCGFVRGDATTNARLTAGEAPPEHGGELVVAVPAESNGWNPFIDQWTDSGTMVGTSMIEPLAVQENDGRVVPWLAESWEPDDSYTRWTLTIRSGVLFHDGTPLDAAAVKKNLDTSLKSGFHSVTAPIYDKIEVIGPLQLRVHLRTAWAQYPASLVNEWIMAPAMLDRTDAGVTDPIGTGPFAFVSWDQGKSLRTRRWDRYWRHDDQGRPLPHLDAVEFRPIVDDRVREEALRTGEVDLALSDAGDITSRLGDEFTVLKDYRGQRTYLVLNTAEGEANKGNPLVNVHARRALAYATDRQRIARSIGQDVQSTTYGFRPDSPWAPQGPDGYVPYDPARARAEIQLYQRDTGARTLSFSIMGLASDKSLTMLQELIASWKDVGIEARITAVESAKLHVLAALGQFQASWFRFYDFPDPDQMNFYLTSANVRPVGEICVNFTHYSSPRLDANLKVLRESVDPAARKAANDDVIRETNEQVINLWLYDTPESLAAAPRVQGLDGFRAHALANNLPKPWLADVWLAR